MNHILSLLMDRPTFHVECSKMSELLTRDEIIDWLDNYQGGGYSLGGSGVYFYDPKDATMFALKWS